MGLGYIGLPTAIIAAKHGIQITGVDINPQVVDMTNAGHLHIIEPGMEEMLQEVVNAGSLKASIKPEGSDAYFMVEEEIVLVDYKTDRVKRGQEQKLIDLYHVQLEDYARAMERMTGKRVKEKIIYSFT